MGDGGCAVLSSRHLLAEFCNSDSCHKEKVKGRCNWTVELSSVGGLALVSEHRPSASSSNDQDHIWTPATMNDMEPGHPCLLAEAAVDEDRQGRCHISQWDVDSENSPLVGALGQSDIKEGLANKSEKETACIHPSQGSIEMLVHQPSSGIESPSNFTQEVVDREESGNGDQHGSLGAQTESPHLERGGPASSIRNLSESAACNPHMEVDGNSEHALHHVDEEALFEGRLPSGAVIASDSNALSDRDTDSKHQFFNKVERNENSSIVHSCCNGLPTSRVEIARTSDNAACLEIKETPDEKLITECNAGAELEGDSERTFQPSKNEKCIATCQSELSSYRVEGESDSMLHSGVKISGCDYHGSEKDTSDRRNADGVDNRSLQSSRNSWCMGEHAEHSHYSDPSSENKLCRDEARHHRGEDNYSNRWHSKLKERSLQSRPSVKHSEISKHRHVMDRHAGRSSNSHGKDAQSRCSNTDKNGYIKNRSDHNCERSNSAKVDILNEEWCSNVVFKDEKSLETLDKASHIPSLVQEHLFSAPVNDDDSGSVEMDIPMDLSPAPAEDSVRGPSEVTWIGAGYSGATEQFETNVTSTFCSESSDGKGWIFFDYDGSVQGPVELSLLRALCREGRLQSDHMVSLDGSNEWVTLEHAGMALSSSQTAVPEVPAKGEIERAPTSLLVQTGGSFLEEQSRDVSMFEHVDHHNIEERVEQLMSGFSLVPGREKEVISEALNCAVKLVHRDVHEDLKTEDDAGCLQLHGGLAAYWTQDNWTMDGVESHVSKDPVLSIDVDNNAHSNNRQSGFQSTRKWTSRGGDWKLVFQAENQGSLKGQAGLERPVKMVLNQGIPLCDSRHSSLPDPRKMYQEPLLHEVARWKHLELPHWAYRYWDAKSHSMNSAIETTNVASKVSPYASNTQVPATVSYTPNSRDGLTFEGSKKSRPCKVNEVKVDTVTGAPLRQNTKGEAGISPRCANVALKNSQSSPVAQDAYGDPFPRAPSCENSSTTLAYQESDYELTKHDMAVSIVEMLGNSSTKLVQHLPTKDDLRLDEGQWFYKDGAGHEVGPFLYKQLQSEVSAGFLCEGSSVYRKSDETWVSFSLDAVTESATFQDSGASCACEAGPLSQPQDEPLHFHRLYPQFMGYMCGELHQHIMKSYRSRDFPAMLDRCFSDKQSKSDMTQQPLTKLERVVPDRAVGLISVQSENSTSQCLNGFVEVKSENNTFDLPSAAITSQGSSVQSSDFPKYRRMGKTKSLQDIEDFKPALRSEDCSLELFEEAGGNGCWSTLEFQLLLKVFTFLQADIRSLVIASATCKSWRRAVLKFKQEADLIDLSCLGSLCSDEVFLSITEHTYKVSRVVLRGCTTVSSSAVRFFLEGHRLVTKVDAHGCEQLKELVDIFPHILWVGSKSTFKYEVNEPLNKLKGSKMFADRKHYLMPKHIEVLDVYSSEGSNLKDKSYFEDVHSDGMTDLMDCDPPQSLDRDLELARSSNSVKRMKLSNSGKYIKLGLDSHCKVLPRDCALVGSLGRDREHLMTPEGKAKQKQASVVGSTVTAQIYSTDKALSKADYLSPIDRLTKLEKEMAQVLQTICQAYDWLSSEFKGIEEKIRRGSYQRIKSGFNDFKDDLLTMCRKFLRKKQTHELKAGQEVYMLAFRLLRQLEEGWKKDVSNSKFYKSKFHDQQSRLSLSGKKRDMGDVARKQGLAKRRKGLDESNADDLWEAETTGSDEDENMFQEEEEEKTDASDFENESDSEVRVVCSEREAMPEEAANTYDRYWGARMTKAAMVPPVTRKYELIEEYVIVADAVEVGKRMGVNLPEDYDKKLQAAQGLEYFHLELPDLRDFQPRKRVQDEVLEQEVYGIDPYTHNLLIDSMPMNRTDFPDDRRHQLIEEDILKTLNQEVRQFSGVGKAPTTFPLDSVVEKLMYETKDPATRSFVAALLRNMRSRPKDKYIAYRKGLGVVCNHRSGFKKDEFVVEFFGEVYPAWRWFEKQDAIRSLQKKDKDPAPEFYNIFLERPKGDAAGYDLLVVDAMHKANYASRICHACRPNCEARVTAVDGQYQIGVYTLRPVEYGEELTFDYNSITESKEEYETSICLCGSQGCRGSYLNFAGPDTFQEIMKEHHGVLHRHDLLLQACINGHASSQDWDDLRQAGLGSCLLEGMPEWTIQYAAGVVRFMNKERKYLPKAILRSMAKERGLEVYNESDALEAEIQADGVFNGRLQNLAITLDKVRYVFKNLYGDPRFAPAPLRKLEPTEVVSLVWKNENSVVAELLDAMAHHSTKEEILELKRKVREHEPSLSGNVEKNLRQALLWLRDELSEASVAPVSRHDAAADLIHLYAHTKLFFTSRDYDTVESPPLTISPQDLGPKHTHLLGTASSYEWRKTYSRDYVLGQLIFWYIHNTADPGASLVKAQRGCLTLPDIASCYAKSSQQRLGYSSIHRSKLFQLMEQKPQRQWSWKGQVFWEFKNGQRLFGSPMMDAVNNRTRVNKEMMDWLKKRRRTFEGPWENQ